MAAPWLCATCGNHFPDPRPEVCVVCADERQWVPPGGQRWTMLSELAAAGHRSDIRTIEPGLTVRPDLRRLVGSRAAVGRVGDGPAVRFAVYRAPARHRVAARPGDAQ